MNEVGGEGLGILAIWNDCAVGHEAEYENWYQGEHLFERLGVPGIERGRRYEAVRADARYFTYYETTSPVVLTSPAYLERLDNPTPLTTKIMSGILSNMSRTVCRVIKQHGCMRGVYAVTTVLTSDEIGPHLDDLWSHLAGQAGVARLEIWVSDNTSRSLVSSEEKMRGGDEKIAGGLFVETLHEDDAHNVEAEIDRRAGDIVAGTGIYRLLCELTSDEVRP